MRFIPKHIARLLGRAHTPPSETTLTGGSVADRIIATAEHNGHLSHDNFRLLQKDAGIDAARAADNGYYDEARRLAR